VKRAGLEGNFNGKTVVAASQRRAIIIGAGPAGLTAAFELITRSDILPIVIEKSSVMEGFPGRINTRAIASTSGPSLLLKIRPGDELVAGTAATWKLIQRVLQALGYQGSVRSLETSGRGQTRPWRTV